MIRTSRLLATLVLPTSLLAAACGDDPAGHRTANFAQADQVHLERAIDTAQARDLGELLFIGNIAFGVNREGCPSFVTTGNVTTVTGGCTNGSGTRLEGTFEITNMAGSDEPNPLYDATQPSTVVANAWTVTSAEGEVASIDGRLEFHADPTTRAVTMSGLVDVVDEGLSVHVDAGYDCDETELCTILDGSWYSVSGLGEAELSGTFRYDDPSTGAITSQGVDALVIDVPGSADGCVSYTVGGGAPQNTCPSAPTARQATAATAWSAPFRK